MTRNGSLLRDRALRSKTSSITHWGSSSRRSHVASDSPTRHFIVLAMREEELVGVLLQGFYFAPGKIAGVPSPLDGDKTIPFWWDHLAAQANVLRKAGFTAIWLPPPQKGASGSFSTGYDGFDDYDLGSKDQKWTIPTRYGTREQLERCAAIFRANGIDLYVDLVENQRDGDDGHFNFEYLDAFGQSPKGPFAKV